MLKLEFTVYSGSTVIDAPGDTSITLTESRIAGSPNMSLGFQMDPPLEDLENHPMLLSKLNGEEGELRTSSSTRTWKYVLRDESERILYKGEVEELSVTNTSTARVFDLVSYEVCYCGDRCEERSFRTTGTEESRASGRKNTIQVRRGRRQKEKRDPQKRKGAAMSAKRKTETEELLFQYRKGDKWGFINRSGNFVIQPQFYLIHSFDELCPSLLLDEFDEKSVDDIFVEEYNQTYCTNNFPDGLIRILVNNKFGFINTHGEIEIIPQYDYVSSFREGVARVKKVINGVS